MKEVLNDLTMLRAETFRICAVTVEESAERLRLYSGRRYRRGLSGGVAHLAILAARRSRVLA